MWKGQNRNAGFSLLEVSIILVIVGTMLAASMRFLASYHRTERIKQTLLHQQLITEALRAHMLLTGSLPCPSDVNSGHSRKKCEDALNANGFVPHIALGLPAKIARDGYGKHIKYVMDSCLRPPYVLNEGLILAKFLSKPSRIEIFCGKRERLHIPFPDGVAFLLISHAPKRKGEKLSRESHFNRKKGTHSFFIDSQEYDSPLSDIITFEKRSTLLEKMNMSHFYRTHNEERAPNLRKGLISHKVIVRRSRFKRGQKKNEPLSVQEQPK